MYAILILSSLYRDGADMLKSFNNKYRVSIGTCCNVLVTSNLIGHVNLLLAICLFHKFPFSH